MIPSPAIRWAIAVDMTSTPGNTGSKGVWKDVAASGYGRANHDYSVFDGFGGQLSMKYIRGAERRDGAARTIEGQRKPLSAIRWQVAVPEGHLIRLERGVDAKCQRRSAKRQRCIHPIRPAGNQRNEPWDAGLVGCNIDHARRGDVGKATERQEHLAGDGDCRQRIVAVARGGLHALGKHACCGNHAWNLLQRRHERRIAFLRSGIDQQEVEGHDLRS